MSPKEIEGNGQKVSLKTISTLKCVFSGVASDFKATR